MYWSPSISIPLICHIPINESLSLPCISTRPACTGLAWDASLLRLPAGHCSSPVLPASLLACSGSQTFPALRHTEGRNSRGTHGHSMANLQKVLLDFFLNQDTLKQREIRFSDTFLLRECINFLISATFVGVPNTVGIQEKSKELFERDFRA